MTKKEFNTILNECLDNLIAGKTDIEDSTARYPEQAKELRTLLAIARSLVSSQPAPEMVAKARAKQKFLAVATRKRNSPQPRFPSLSLFFRPILAGTATIVAAFSLFFGLGAVAADNSLPGDTLYPLKLTVEGIQENLAGNEETRASVSVAVAERRNQELLSLSDKPERITTDFLNSVADSTQRAAQLALPVDDNDQLVERMSNLLTQQEKTLSKISATLPEKAQPGLERAITVTQLEKDEIGRERIAPANDEQKNQKSARGRGNPNAARRANPDSQKNPTITDPTRESFVDPTTMPDIDLSAEPDDRSGILSPTIESGKSQPGSSTKDSSKDPTAPGNNGRTNNGRPNDNRPGNVKPGNSKNDDKPADSKTNNPGNDGKQADSKPGNSGSTQPQDNKPGNQGQKDLQDQRQSGQEPDSRGKTNPER